MKRTYCPNKKNGKQRENGNVRYVENPCKRLATIEQYKKSSQAIQGFKNIYESGNIIELFEDMIA